MSLVSFELFFFSRFSGFPLACFLPVVFLSIKHLNLSCAEWSDMGCMAAGYGTLSKLLTWPCWPSRTVKELHADSNHPTTNCSH